MYESKISNAKWIACDIPGNVGWIAFLVGLILCFARRPEAMENGAVLALLVAELFCGAAMVVGVIELICERVLGLDRVLPGKRLCRGFGALTFGGLGGMVISLPALAIALLNGLDGAAYIAILWGGGFLCALFAGIILKEYKKIVPDSDSDAGL